jgi:prepilin-type N-terminal cleavage/methylation domain-containing protein
VNENRRAGFTLVEMLIALTLGVIVVSAAIQYFMTEFRVLAANDVREVVARNGRYIGVAVRRDLQRAGVGIETTTTFGTVDTWPGTYGDTLVVLYVPYIPRPAPPHTIVPPDGVTENPLPPGSTCGLQCIEVTKEAEPALELEAGSLGRLQVLAGRRLVLIESTNVTSDTSVELKFTDAATLLGQRAGMADLSLDRFGTYAQELQPVVYYLDEDRLMRAVRLNLDGSPAGQVLAYGVEDFDVELVFFDGDVYERVNVLDTDDSNDYDDVSALKITVTLKADRVHPLVNGGEPLERTFVWTIAPRNLRYEKNRL